MKALPIVRFARVRRDAEFDWMYRFLFDDDWGWGRYILRKHPRLHPVLLLKRKKERERFINQYIDAFHASHAAAISGKAAMHERRWRKVESKFFTTSAEIINIAWPRRVITALLSLNPICPRLLRSWSFFYYFDYSVQDVREVIMHECIHFLYFEKWRKLFPHSRVTSFESPHIVWHLSELIAPIILNDARMQKLLKKKAVFYKEHERIRISSVSAPRYLTRLYRNMLDSGNDFGKFVRAAFRVVRAHKKEFQI